MEVYFLQNSTKIEVNPNAEVKRITVASRRPNPSSSSDSKGGVYIRMFLFPPHPKRIQWLRVTSNNVFEKIFVVVIWCDVAYTAPAVCSSYDLCVVCCVPCLTICAVYISQKNLHVIIGYSVLFAFYLNLILSFSQGLYTIPTYSKRSHLDAQR